MGSSCSKCGVAMEPSPFDPPVSRSSGSDGASSNHRSSRDKNGWSSATTVPYTVDPAMHDLMKRSYAQAQWQQAVASGVMNGSTQAGPGQGHLLYKQQQKMSARLYNHHNQHSNASHLSPYYKGGGTINARESPPKRSTKKQQQVHHEKTAPSGGGPLHDLHDAEELDDLLYPPDGSAPRGSVGGGSEKFQQQPWNMYSTACPTKLVVRRHSVRSSEEGLSGTHIYAVRWPADQPLALQQQSQSLQQQQPQQEQHPSSRSFGRGTALIPAGALRKKNLAVEPTLNAASTLNTPTTEPDGSAAAAAGNVDHLFKPSAMGAPPKQKVVDWVTVSDEHCIYVADVGMTAADCDRMVQVTEQVCRGQYAAYTYAKQTLGCREFPVLAASVQDAVHTITHAIVEFSKKNQNNNSSGAASKVKLALDDREPHMVKYDVTKKERQKLDMHTDKSEWTFLVALSNGCGMDYEGGGTYFECLDATVHLQRGHALVFPGKLRHCGQRITAGLRFLLVGFLVDKTTTGSGSTSASSGSNNLTSGGGSSQVEIVSSSAAGTSAASSSSGPERDNDGFPTAIDLTNVP